MKLTSLVTMGIVSMFCAAPALAFDISTYDLDGNGRLDLYELNEANGDTLEQELMLDKLAEKAHLKLQKNKATELFSKLDDE